MRALLLLSIAALVCLPFAAANPVPILAIRLDQSTQNANATNASQPVIFTGEVEVQKSAFLSATVTLEGIVDKGWQAEVSPASMTFTTTTPQAFTCTVLVPAATAGGTTAQLTVNGTIVSGLLQSKATTTAVINILGTSPPTNQTGNNTNGTKPTNGTNQSVTGTGFVSNQISAGFLGFSNDQWMMIAVVVVLVAIAAVAVVKVRRRRNAALEVESVETAEEA